MEIEVDGIKIKVNLKESKGENLRLRAYDDYSLDLFLPKKAKKKDIDLFLKSAKGWISKYYKSRANTITLPDYENPLDHIYILGQKYDLSFLKGEDRVSLEKKRIVVSSTSKHNHILKEYFESMAKDYMDKLLFSFQDFFDNERLQRPKVTYRKMVSRWGSCNKKLNKINLNYHLFQVDEELIEYVILHELCHLVHPNHQRDFHELLFSYMGDYKRRRKLLRNNYSLARA